MWDQHTTWAKHYNLAYRKEIFGEGLPGQNGKNCWNNRWKSCMPTLGMPHITAWVTQDKLFYFSKTVSSSIERAEQNGF